MRDTERNSLDLLADFVDRHITSFLAWDVILYFQRNPHAVTDPQDLATRLGRSPTELEPEVAKLCLDGILARDAGSIYYAPDRGLSERVDAFVEACGARETRMVLVARTLNHCAMREI